MFYFIKFNQNFFVKIQNKKGLKQATFSRWTKRAICFLRVEAKT